MPSSRSRRPAHDELARLVRNARTGDAASLNALLAAIRPWIVRYVARRITPAVAEDLAQIALTRIARSVSRIDPERADRYLATVVRNLLRTEYRKRARDADRHVPLECAEDIEAPERADRDLEEEELTRIIRDASREQLPPALHDIVLGLLRGLTPSEIATRAHLNPITIRTRLLRARTVLRRELSIHVASIDAARECPRDCDEGAPHPRCERRCRSASTDNQSGVRDTPRAPPSS